jgi:alpha-1,2-mannosyltransferase
VLKAGRVAVLTAVPPAKRRGVKQALIVLAFTAGVWAFLAIAAERHGFFDLKVYYGAINHWINSGGNLYDFLLPRTEYGFTYPPFAALLMSPMAMVSWHVAIAISLALTVGATAFLLRWMVLPIVKRQGWTPWFAMVLAVGLVAAFEPVRETVNFGQVNLLLLFLVAADLLLFVQFGKRFGGIGIGLATAIKLTPGIFILYLIVTKRYRAAAVASATAATATWLAATLAPDASRVFWTDAIWNTDRVGSTAFVSNQSINGLVSRLNPAEPSKLLWIGLALVTLLFWAYRSRRAVAAGDELTGLALTGVVGCLVSPITWIHHLVWALPAVILLFDHALVPGQERKRRRWLLGFAIATYLLLCSRLVWVFHAHFGDWGLIGSNAYVLAMIGLLIWLPLRRQAEEPGTVSGDARPTVEDVPDLVELDRRVTAAFQAKDAGLPVEGEADPLVEPARPLVGAENP